MLTAKSISWLLELTEKLKFVFHRKLVKLKKKMWKGWKKKITTEKTDLVHPCATMQWSNIMFGFPALPLNMSLVCVSQLPLATCSSSSLCLLLESCGFFFQMPNAMLHHNILIVITFCPSPKEGSRLIPFFFCSTYVPPHLTFTRWAASLWKHCPLTVSSHERVL